MKAIIISQAGGPEVLKISERPKPSISDTEVLIKVAAAGINRPDAIQREGRYPAPPGAPADIPGLEVSGEIVELGSNVKNWKIGDKVCALVAGGGYAEYVACPMEQCLRIPEGLSSVEAASLPETFFTVWTNVFDRARFKSGEKVLIHGGTSGIGVSGIQMIKAMGGIVYASAGSKEKCDFAESLGASKCINYKNEDFLEVIKEIEPQGIDIILDMIGGDYTEKNIDLLKPEGRLCIINAMKNAEAKVNLMKIMVKRLYITGSTLRARTPEFKGQIARNLEEHIWPLIEKKQINPVINKTFNLEEASDAHAYLDSGQHIGKIVLNMDY